MSQQLRVTTFPHLSVVHHNGTIIETFPGFRTDLELIQELTNLEQLPIFQNIQESSRRQEAEQYMENSILERYYDCRI